MDNISCRGCRNPIAGDAGCALCASVKPHLCLVDDEEAVPLARLATETANLLRRQLSQLNHQQKRLGPNEYDAKLAAESRAHAQALAKLLEAARKILSDGKAAIDAMAWQERAALFLEWVIALPPAYRRRVRDDIDRHIPPQPGESKSPPAQGAGN